MHNPLVGKTIAFTYETGFPGASIEIDFFSEHQKTVLIPKNWTTS
jgi:hypothetical protein